MEYRVLGTLEVRDGDRLLPLAGAKQRALLTLLLVNANHVVSRDRLIDQIWGDQPPDTAVQSLHVYVSRLRKLLPPETLLTRPPGYVLAAKPDELDLDRFERMLAKGRKALDAGDARRAANVLHEALLLWHGPALAEFAFEPFAQAEIGRLEDLRLAAIEDRIEADLALGRHADLVGELEALIAENPHRERLRGHLILAYYRSGRQAEALAAYQDARAALVDELGIEPSADLQQLERQILTHDQALDLPPRPRPVAVDTRQAPGPAAQRPGGEPGRAHGAEPLVRKTVSVLFCDVTGSTSLGERMDPETLRRVMLEYFDEMRAAIERHGGTVEKFIGDAVMAVFGVPIVHEDDALRAVRAADEMRRALTRLNNELDERFGVRLEMRIGINTGEVVVGDPTAEHLIATGDAINVAARLQQAAQPGEILLGRETHRLVADRIRAGPLESFPLKGKSEPVPTWRLDEVRAGAELIFRRLDSPLVGRERERDFLRGAYRTVIEDQSCRLVTVLGAAGVGKTRLAQEVAARSFGASVAQGRCLSYGEGITFFPIAEVVRSLAGVAADDDEPVVKARIAQLLPPSEEAEVVTERLVGLLAADGAARAEEVFWAVRKLLEVVARSRPLVLVLEDLHWAEPMLLDLVEYLVGWSRGAPMLVLALARPELLELRPGWPGERLTLEPLDTDDIRTLLGNLLGSAQLDAQVASRIERAADGNPLFVEELVRMLVDDGTLVLDDGRWVARDVGDLPIPPSINALLAARLDRLDPEEQTVLQCASVIGKQFWWSAVADLAPPTLGDRVGAHLHSLVRKRLVFPAESTSFVSEDSFRFGHILVRDAAYAAMPKATRAELHERFAAWLEQKGGHEEFRGHHLERAYLARGELGPADDATRALGERAATLLASAGRRAFGRDDLPAASALLDRAAALPLEPAAHAETLLALGVALRWTGEQTRAARVLGEALDGARALQDDRLAARVEIEESALRAMTDSAVLASELVEVAERSIAVFRSADDDVGLAKAWILLAEAHWIRGSCGDMERVLEDALQSAERGDAERELRWVMRALMRAAVLGPRRVDDAILRCRELQERGRGDAALSANSDSMLAVLEAMRGNADEARRLYGRSKATLEEAGLKTILASLQMYAGMAELVSGDAVAAERELRLGYALLDDMGEQDRLSTTAAYLARALVAQQRYDEADLVARVSETSASDDDLASQVISRGTKARIVARRDDDGSAERLATEAVELSRETDLLGIQGDALVDLANVLTVLGQPQRAATALADAAALYEQKGNVVSAARALSDRRELADARPV